MVAIYFVAAAALYNTLRRTGEDCALVTHVLPINTVSTLW